jgi:hypothetical protein
MITLTIATKENNKAAAAIIILSLLQWEDHIDFGKNIGSAQATCEQKRQEKRQLRHFCRALRPSEYRVVS